MANERNPAGQQGSSPGRRRQHPDESRRLILDAVERLIHSGGHASVSARSVAKEAGLKPPLVHYYYPTLDDLLTGFYRRAAERQRRDAAGMAASEHALRELWGLSTDPARGALGAEFLALAKHRQSIRQEIAREVDAVRDAQADLIRPLLERSRLLDEVGSAEGAALLIFSVARALVTEAQIGVTKGHADAIRFMEAWIARIEERTDGNPGPRKEKIP